MEENTTVEIGKRCEELAQDKSPVQMFTHARTHTTHTHFYTHSTNPNIQNAKKWKLKQKKVLIDPSLI